MIKKIDLYLLRYFFFYLAIVVTAFGLTFCIINLIEGLRDFIDHKVPLTTILQYYVYFFGWVIKSFLPMFILLAALFAISSLSRRNEILAMKASGLSLYRLTLPILITVMIISGGHFYYNEIIYPPWNKRRLEIKNFTIKQKSKRTFTRQKDIYRQIEPGYFYTIGTFNVERQEGRNFRLYQSQNNRLSRIITSEHIDYRDSHWFARKGVERIFTDRPGLTFLEFDSMMLPDIEEKPEDFAKRLGKPEDMGYRELQSYIDLMKRTGGPYLREKIDLQIKIAFPLASVIVVLICIPYAANPRRGGIAVSIAIGALISLIYFISFRILQSAGYSEKVSEPVAVWGINSLFFVVGIVSILKARK